MNVHHILFVIAAIVVVLLSTPQILQADNQRVRILIAFDGPANPSSIESLGGIVLHTYSLVPHLLAAEIPTSALDGLLHNPHIIGFEYDAEVTALAPVQSQGRGAKISQPPQMIPWGVDRIDAELSIYDGQGISVCIIDTGIDQDHPDLRENILGGRNFATRGTRSIGSKWNDDNGHGTHVAGTIAALDNSIGVLGVAPQASIIAAKVLDSSGNGYVSDVIAGIDYCANSGARILSLSLGTSSDLLSLHQAVDSAYVKGALLVAAAGNNYGGMVSYPAAYDSVIAVSATDNTDTLALFSSVGAQVELSAPGAVIPSTWKGGGYATLSGTSMATPHVSGTAALLFEQNPSRTNEEVRTILAQHAYDLGETGRDSLYGFGLVRANIII